MFMPLLWYLHIMFSVCIPSTSSLSAFCYRQELHIQMLLLSVIYKYLKFSTTHFRMLGLNQVHVLNKDKEKRGKFLKTANKKPVRCANFFFNL